MSLSFRATSANIIIFGNTYPHKERIKALGARFNGMEKNWQLPLSDANLQAVEELCDAVGGGGMVGGTAASTTSPAPASASVSLSDQRQASDPQDLTLRQLVDRAYGAIASAFAEPMWVVAELQNVAGRQQAYFFDVAEARDDQSKSNQATLALRAVLWRNTWQVLAGRHGEEKLKAVLADGLQVRLKVRVSLYRERGSLSLTVEDIDPAYTQGALALAREKLLKELRAKGLDRTNKQLSLSPFPLRLGLITARGSRAFSDFYDQLISGGYVGRVLFENAAMQGDATPKQVKQALQKLSKQGVDVIVLTRGGGSAADLRWFDDPQVAYAIAECPVPVIAAIGHHDDICVAELISHQRQKTPTAAAVFVLEHLDQTRRRIDDFAEAMANALSREWERALTQQSRLADRLQAVADQHLQHRRQQLRELYHQVERFAVGHLHRGQARLQQLATLMAQQADDQVQRRTRRLVQFGHVLGRAAGEAWHQRDRQLEQLQRHMLQRDPRPWLERGWTRLDQTAGAHLKSIAEAKVGSELWARLRDGRLKLTITDIEKRNATATPESQHNVSKSSSNEHSAQET